ncbi:MAG: rhomboid family intramembrane serine protease [Polyangiaceae bacterium]
MFPIGDQNPTRTVPFVNYALIAANIAVFVWQYILYATGGEAGMSADLALVPARFTANPLAGLGMLFTSMFMHGGWGHLGGNMLYLYIFGDNVEDAMGHVRYALFYLACGVGAALAQVGMDPSSTIPMVGASGAIAGALGGYLVLYPRAPITVINPVPLLWLLIGLFVTLPAWLAIGSWFLMNLWNALTQPNGGGGVAFVAHVGGFIVGMLSVRLVVRGRRPIDRGRWTGWRPPARSSWSANSSRSWY